MSVSKKHQLQDLIEKIERVDKMIKLHQSNPSAFMLEQYESKKEKLLSYLIDELVNPKLRSAFSFKLILMALSKYYPELVLNPKTYLVNDKHYEELKDLEAALVA